MVDFTLSELSFDTSLIQNTSHSLLYRHYLINISRCSLDIFFIISKLFSHCIDWKNKMFKVLIKNVLGQPFDQNGFYILILNHNKAASPPRLNLAYSFQKCSASFSLLKPCLHFPEMQRVLLPA